MRKSDRLYLDIHVLQTVPSSCLNRDDTGSPKTAIYGGVTRSRVSSQSWKRAMRLMFRELFPSEMLGVRTKKVVDLLAEEIDRHQVVEDPYKAAVDILTAADLKVNSDKKTDALFFIGRSQITALANLIVENPGLLEKSASNELKKRALEALTANPAIDVALFGRMAASNPSLNTDACAQVAHSLSTHKVVNEFDYFTAVDDIAPEDHAGAGHIGTVEFNSSTMYRYATVALHQLYEHLAEESVEAAVQFVRAFVLSMPSGKQNTFANRTLPDAVMVTLRNDQPINLVGAFEKAVPVSEEGYAEPSARRLMSHAKKVYEQFAGSPVLSLTTGQLLAELGEEYPLPEMLDRLADSISHQLTEGRDV